MTRQQFFPLFVIMLAAGMAFYFTGASEPAIWGGVGVAAIFASVSLLLLRWLSWPVLRPVLILANAVVLGALWAQAMSYVQLHKWHSISFPEAGVEVDISGTVLWAEPRIRGSLLDVEIIGPDAKPYRLRLFGKKQMAETLRPGCGFHLLALLKPIGKPFASGSYDPRLRHLFDGRKGQGFIRQVNQLTCPERLTWSARLARLRLSLAASFRDRLAAPYGGVAAALVTGIRGGISKDTRDVFRTSGLAHMLAISGLHMALFAGSCFAALRLLAATSPWLAQRYDMRRIAAAVAILAACGYLAISGASFATQRAFVMIGIVFLAILLGRAGLTLRNLAWAALVIFLWRPSAVMQAGFQMSFAAVLALISYYEYWQSQDRLMIFPSDGQRVLRLVYFIRRYIWALLLTSLIAGSVTGYLAAYHFGQVGRYSLLTNLLAMPIFAAIVIPMAVASLALMPLGLAHLPMLIMQEGLRAILAIAEAVTGLPASVIAFGPSPSWSLPVAVVGLLVLCLLRTRWRWGGALAMLLAVVMLGRAERPLIAIVDAGNTVFVQAAGGDMQAIAHPSFWGGDVYQADLAMRYWRATLHPAAPCDDALCGFALADGRRLALVRYRRGLTQACKSYDIVVAPLVTALYPCRATLLDRPKLRQGRHFELYESAPAFAVVQDAPRPRLWQSAQ